MNMTILQVDLGAEYRLNKHSALRVICSIKGLSFGSKDFIKELKTVKCFLGQTSYFRPIRFHQ